MVRVYTAPGVEFEDRASLQAHYKSDWHRYNLKRKVAGLPPLPKDQFEARKAAALAARAENAAGIGKQDHVKPEKKEQVAARRRHQRAEGDAVTPASPPATPQPASLASPLSAADPATPPPPPAQGMTAQVQEQEEDDDEEMVEIDTRDSLFDSHREADLHGALDYMRRTYGFFLPDAEYIVDLGELIEYLHQKVRIGRCCLYCQRTFRSCQACKQHMVDKSHCKIKYDDDEDISEFADFYDFSSSYDVVASSSARGAAEDDGEEEDDDEEAITGQCGIEVLPSGELLVTRADGSTRRLGVRWLKRYYDQNARLIDEREAVVAAQRERLERMYTAAGIDTRSAVGRELMAASTTRGGSLALAKGIRAENRFVGSELVVARRHFRSMHNARMKLGMQQNWLIKNKTAKKNRGEGVGVHG